MLIHSFESLATLDGDGIRYCIFLSGCPLKCAYCHNPDTQFGRGENYSIEAVFKKIIRYIPYFQEGNGGVTFSGGEPLLQADEIAKIWVLLQKEKVNYVIDTSGAVPLNENVKFVLKNAKNCLCDLKFYDSETFLKWCGDGFDNVLKTLNFLNENNVSTVIRTVIVPGVNDDKKSIDKYFETLKPYFNCVKKYELLAFHTMGFFKYDNLGLENRLKNVKPLEKEKLIELQDYLDGLIVNFKQ